MSWSSRRLAAAHLDRPRHGREISDLPLIGFRHCRSTVAAEAYLRANGGDPQWVFRSDDNTTVQALVSRRHRRGPRAAPDGRRGGPKVRSR
jgi:hypothetical protein